MYLHPLLHVFGIGMEEFFLLLIINIYTVLAFSLNIDVSVFSLVYKCRLYDFLPSWHVHLDLSDS